jgi:hypothetical protein
MATATGIFPFAGGVSLLASGVKEFMATTLETDPVATTTPKQALWLMNSLLFILSSVGNELEERIGWTACVRSYFVAN